MCRKGWWPPPSGPALRRDCQDNIFQSGLWLRQFANVPRSLAGVSCPLDASNQPLSFLGQSLSPVATRLLIPNQRSPVSGVKIRSFVRSDRAIVSGFGCSGHLRTKRSPDFHVCLEGLSPSAVTLHHNKDFTCRGEDTGRVRDVNLQNYRRRVPGSRSRSSNVHLYFQLG